MQTDTAIGPSQVYEVCAGCLGRRLIIASTVPAVPRLRRSVAGRPLTAETPSLINAKIHLENLNVTEVIILKWTLKLGFAGSEWNELV